MRALRKGAYRLVAGQSYDTPKELWGFRTAPVAGRPSAVAAEFLASNAQVLGIASVLEHLHPDPRKVLESRGACHVIFQHHHLGLRIHRAYVTVHMDRDGRVYLCKSRAVPVGLPRTARFPVSERAARGRARRAVPRGRIEDVERIWLPRGTRLRPSYRVRIHRGPPTENWIIYVDGVTGGILSRYDNAAWGVGRARVFDPNPVAALGTWDSLLTDAGNPRRKLSDACYASVRLAGLDGTGHLDGRRVSTGLTRNRAWSRDHQFQYASTDRRFEEVMAYFHVDRAIRYLESLGYRGKRAIFREVVRVNARGSREDESCYSPFDRALSFGTGGVDDAEDAEIILHELGHAIQDAICPGFGQSHEAAAMGEGFSDYFAASTFAERKPPTLRAAIGSWDCIADGGAPPCLRRVDEPLTFGAFVNRLNKEHHNGQIWSSALWEIRDRVGRDVADPIIIESHFQLDGFTTFARGARAIVDADRNLFEGAHRRVLRRVFRGRGIGPV